ncbi:SCO family protein [Psychrosphaera algicola]|uniref:SCO family protein n=1 Tax=Psychrosphaera algicola TaxID=3023714 RepID=A0ABT5FF19_9GAMM|nr:SCO family protein [Psychrosphaera sp. G1-22]MDC2889639.1 SCO family protein [Psychrosphaera sp. G1-22]
MKNYYRLITLISVLCSNLLFANAIADEMERLPYYDSAEFTPKWLKSDSLELNDMHQISDFKFIDQRGKYVTADTFRDKIYVASFFFTTCPGICPKMRSQLSKVQEAYADKDYFKIISHSIQPTNDTVEILQTYAKENGINANQWHLVTGNMDEIYNLARNDYFANEDLGEYVSNKDFLHTENLVLIDHNKHIRGIYNGLNNASVGNLIGDIKLLEQELKSTRKIN